MMETTGFSRRNGRLCAENVPLSEIAERFGTPCYVYSRRALLDNLSRIKINFARSKPTVFFAVKANSNIAVLQLLHRAGCGFDIVSAGELARVLAAGGSAKQTVFSGVGKSLHDMRTALAAGVGCFNVESLAELARLEALAKEQKTRAPIAFRINPNIYAGTHDYLTTGGDDNKFGISPRDLFDLESGDLLPKYQRIVESPHLDLIGLSCHLGSQITNGEAYIDAALRMSDYALYTQRAGIKIRHLDMGGGFAVNYETGETPAVALEQYDEKLAALFPDTEIWLEPGRAIAATAGVLLTTVEYIKQTGKTYWIVDAGMNVLLRPALYGARHRVEDVDGDGDSLIGDVAGPICESGDVLANDCELRAKAGDLLAVRDVGAYGASMMSTYNSHPRPCEVLVSGDQTALIRERDREEDLLHGESLANFRAD